MGKEGFDTMVAKSPMRISSAAKTMSGVTVMILLFSLFVFIAGIVLFALAWRRSQGGVSIPEETKVIVVTTPSGVGVGGGVGVGEGAASEPPIYPRKSPEYPLRNAPRDYQQVGVLVDSPSGDGAEPTLLALFGRKMRTRDRWEYYAASDKYHMWKLPVQVQKRMCDHEFGCDEIYNGDQVIVPDYGNRTFTARMYAYASPDGQSYL